MLIIHLNMAILNFINKECLKDFAFALCSLSIIVIIIYLFVASICGFNLKNC